MFDSALERPAGVRHAFRGEIALARATLQRLAADADDRGDARLGVALHIQLCELALRSGYTADATRLMDEWRGRSVEFAGQLRLMNLRCAALLAAVTGEPELAHRLASEVAASIEPGIGEDWNRLEAQRASGIAALLQHDAVRAVARLRAVWDHTIREGVDDPGAFPVAGDLTEALLEGGRPAEAREVTQVLAKQASEQDHPWGLITAKRGAAALRLFDGYDPNAAADLVGAAADYDRLELRFDRARTLLFLGRLQRRHKKRGDARRALELARDAFVRLGCHGWADEARLELTRVSGRRPTDGGVMTASEERVAKLAADGLSNKEIAKQLFVSVYTVEAHLSSAYSKLGIRSRSALARTLKVPG